MTDPLRDPRFPDRPQTPDFWRLSEVALDHDARAVETEDVGQILAEMVDEPSLMYMAEHRLGNAFGITPVGVGPGLFAVLMGIYYDAFAKGVDFQKRGGHRPNETGSEPEKGE